MKSYIGAISVAVMLVIQLAVFAYGYGMLSQQVAFNRQLITSYQTNQALIMTKLDNLTERITKLETLIQMQK